MDVVAIQEVGINFTYAGVNSQWKTRIGWNTLLDAHRAKTVNAWNSQSHQRKHQQYGGTAILALGRTTFYAAGSGFDPTKLGRWCWTRYRGAEGMHLHIISFYRPNDNTSGTALSVVAQHCRYFYDHDDDRHPRQAFLEDLCPMLANSVKIVTNLVVAKF